MMKLAGALPLTLALLHAAAAHAQDTAPVFSPDAARAHVTFLASDELEGRDAGTRGFDIASRYVATQFAGMGLTPAVNGDWYQTVDLAVATLDKAAEASVTIGGARFAHGGDVLMGPSAREAVQEVTAPAVFVGYGIDSPENGVRDYRGLNVKGKIVVALTGFPKGMRSDIGAHLNAEKVAMAQKHGAIGLITIPTTASLERRSWERMQEMSDGIAVSWRDAEGTVYTRAGSIRVGATVHGAAADALFAGSGRTIAQIRAAADKDGAKPKGFALKPSITFRRSSTMTISRSQNVIGLIPGSDPALANQYVLLTGHLDHLGIKPDAKGNDKLHNGAMDNAAGIATLIEVARAFANAREKPKRSILVAALTAEEDGLLGAQYLAKHPVVPAGGKVVGVVNLDMPVLLYDFADVIAFGAEHSELGPMVEKATASVGVKLSPDPLPAEGLFTRSDHYRFVQEGVPSVFLMTGFGGEGAKQFEGFLATHYHKPSDEPALPFNWDAAAKFAKINHAIATSIANAPAAPRWYEDSFFGSTFAPSAPKAPAPKP